MTRSPRVKASRWRSRWRRCSRTTATRTATRCSLAEFTQPAHGTLSRAGGVVTYTPDAGYAGPDSFGYTVSDGSLSDTATVSIAVEPANTAPVAGDDAVSTGRNAALAIPLATLFANDSDADGDTLSLADFSQPAHGTLSNAKGTLAYTPNGGYVGPDSFSYTVSDGRFSDTATVGITVTGPAAPIVSDDFSGATLGSAWSVAGPAATRVRLATTATDALLELVTPDGDYSAWNGNNTSARAMQSVADSDFQLEARFLSRPTLKFQMQGFFVEQDAQNWIRLETHFDGSRLKAFGAVTVNGVSCQKFKVTVAGDDAPYLRVTRSGDTWTLEWSRDGESWTSRSFTHDLTVTKVGLAAGNAGAPQASPQGSTTSRTARARSWTRTARSRRSTPPRSPARRARHGQGAPWRSRWRRCWRTTATANGDALNLASFTQPAHGTLSRAGGVLTYRPDAGYVGPDSFGYTVSDGSLSDTGTVSIAVGNPMNVWYRAGADLRVAGGGAALDQHPRQRRGRGRQARVLAERRGDAEALDWRRRAPPAGRRRLQRRHRLRGAEWQQHRRYRYPQGDNGLGPGLYAAGRRRLRSRPRLEHELQHRLGRCRQHPRGGADRRRHLGQERRRRAPGRSRL